MKVGVLARGLYPRVDREERMKVVVLVSMFDRWWRRYLVGKVVEGRR